MKLKREKVKRAVGMCAYVIAVLAVLAFGFFAVYTDIKHPGTTGMSLAEIMQSVAEFRGGELTEADLEHARFAAMLIVGGFAAGAMISALGMFLVKRYPENKWVRLLFMDPEEVESKEQK